MDNMVKEEANLHSVPAIGSMAPDFALPADDGRTARLSDYRGQRVVLYFYPKDMTSGCTTQACGFRDNYAEIEERNAVVRHQPRQRGKPCAVQDQAQSAVSAVSR
jgi:peroxiredoxin